MKQLILLTVIIFTRQNKKHAFLGEKMIKISAAERRYIKLFLLNHMSINISIYNIVNRIKTIDDIKEYASNIKLSNGIDWLNYKGFKINSLNKNQININTTIDKFLTEKDYSSLFRYCKQIEKEFNELMGLSIF